jgi:hypothetical protein
VKKNNLERLTRKVLIVMDDLANQLFASEEIANMFLMKSNHENVSLGFYLLGLTRFKQ